ncbi:1235_t:CDS:1, partial [Paraglomus brasilianum]
TLTSDERNLLNNPPYALNIPLRSLTNPKRRNRNLKPPRPSNPWILFRTNFANMLRSLYPENSYSIQDVSRMASEDWQNQPIIVKHYFNTLAKFALQRHKETYSGYVYRPRPKQLKKKNWSFREVKFIERKISNNKQEGAGEQ